MMVGRLLSFWEGKCSELLLLVSGSASDIILVNILVTTQNGHVNLPNQLYKCRQIYHTWILSDLSLDEFFSNTSIFVGDRLTKFDSRFF